MENVENDSRLFTPHAYSTGSHAEKIIEHSSVANK
jgi:hypothetical protein